MQKRVPAQPEVDEDLRGYISEESSFYGDDDQRDQLEEAAAKFDFSAWLATYQKTPAAIASKAQGSAALSNPSPELKIPESGPRLFNAFEGRRSARQLSEDVASFLGRLPALTTSSLRAGPWLWIANPYTSQRVTDSDLAGLTQTGQSRLSAWAEQKASIEKQLKGSPQYTIKHTLAKERKAVEEQLLQEARERGCTTGKWMLFPVASSINSIWNPVAEATANNTLGTAAKVATATEESSDRGPRLVCVYTKDFADVEDVKRVLERLVELGVVQTGRKGIYYKCDAYTHLGISSGNEWGIPASMYSSNDLLDKKKR
ncbi:MAG: hypothetical protein M4579_003021 [Chaenotheca gracillima]|nr:MAG: hypothetical protein M4579_003021 [Chaenotheca gracillima]